MLFWGLYFRVNVGLSNISFSKYFDMNRFVTQQSVTCSSNKYCVSDSYLSGFRKRPSFAESCHHGSFFKLFKFRLQTFLFKQKQGLDFT